MKDKMLRESVNNLVAKVNNLVAKVNSIEKFYDNLLKCHTDHIKEISEFTLWKLHLLYNYLGITEKTEPAKPSTILLVKKTKKK